MSLICNVNNYLDINTYMLVDITAKKLQIGFFFAVSLHKNLQKLDNSCIF